MEAAHPAHQTHHLQHQQRLLCLPLPLHACRMPGHIHNWAGAASLGPAAASMGHRHAGLPTASSVHNYGVLGAEQFRPPATRQVGGAANSPAPGLGPAAPPPLKLGQQSGTCTCWMRHRTTAETRYPMWQLCVSGQQQQQQSSTNERERERGESVTAAWVQHLWC
jgi:hypothetical protein